MAFSQVLHSADLGNYRWGSLLPRFTKFAIQSRQALVDQLVMRSQRLATWDTERTFRSYVAFIHEVTHFLQDVSTGIGHWDYLVSASRVPDILGEGRLAMVAARYVSLPDRLPIKTSPEELYSQLAFVLNEHMPEERRLALYTELVKYDPTLEDGDETAYFPQGFFEAEAVANTYLEWLQLRDARERANEIALQNQHFVVPWGMPATYSDLILHFGQVFLQPFLERKGLGEALETTIVQAVLLLFLNFVDLASACPPPSVFAREGLSWNAYEPGLRFLRLARAYQRAPDSMNDQFIEAIYRSDVVSLETLLAPFMEYQYLPYNTTYQAWADELLALPNPEDDRILKLRVKATHARLRDPGCFVRKNPASFAAHQLRLPLISHGGKYVDYAWNLDLIEPEEGTAFFADLMRHNRDLSLADHFLLGTPFTCPLAETGVCPIREQRCQELVTLEDLPDGQECCVRAGLTDAGFF